MSPSALKVIPGVPPVSLVRVANEHPDPYHVRYFQIDNEPMNNGFTPERYAAIVNVYGSRMRALTAKAAPT